MNRKKLPRLQSIAPLDGLTFQVLPQAAKRWQPDLRSDSNTDNSITIFEQIGQDPWTGEGVTAKRIAAALRQIGDQDITVSINSPGGDMFEGVSIYNMLRAHSGKVTVKVLGIAASAASIVAMAGDELLMGEGAYLMIHNCMAAVFGNRHTMLEAAARLEPFDLNMADIYSIRSGVDKNKIISMMDEETFINASDAVEQGFADGYVAEPIIQASMNEEAASVLLDAISFVKHATRVKAQQLKLIR